MVYLSPHMYTAIPLPPSALVKRRVECLPGEVSELRKSLKIFILQVKQLPSPVNFRHGIFSVT